MSVSADDLLDWAKAIPIHDECDVRAIISRAYLAAFHRCLEWNKLLVPKGTCSQNAGQHERLIQMLMTPSLAHPPATRQRSKDLGKALQDLKALRVLADYQIHRGIPKSLEAQACAEADAIFAMT